MGVAYSFLKRGRCALSQSVRGVDEMSEAIKQTDFWNV